MQRLVCVSVAGGFADGVSHNLFGAFSRAYLGATRHRSPTGLTYLEFAVRVPAGRRRATHAHQLGDSVTCCLVPER